MQFPIAITPADFAEQRPRIGALPQDQQAIIESFQPYNQGGEVSDLRLLNRLSNVDKHQVVTPVFHVPSAIGVTFEGEDCSVESVEWLGTGARLRIGTDIARLSLGGVFVDPHVRVRGAIVADIESEDGWSLEVALMGIGSEVVRIVEGFEPILEPQDVPMPSMFRRRPWAQFATLP